MKLLPLMVIPAIAVLIAAGVTALNSKKPPAPSEAISGPNQALPDREFSDDLEGRFGRVAYESFGEFYQSSAVEVHDGRATSFGISLAVDNDPDFSSIKLRALKLARSFESLDRSSTTGEVGFSIQINGEASDGRGNLTIQRLVSFSRIRGNSGKINWTNPGGISFEAIFRTTQTHQDFAVPWAASRWTSAANP